MERYRKLEIKLKDTISIQDKTALYDLCATGEAEIVNKDGETIVWFDTPDAEDFGIEMLRGNKHKEFARFPKRWAETTDLSEEGMLSNDGTKKLVSVTPENLSKYSKIRKDIPADYTGDEIND